MSQKVQKTEALRMWYTNTIVDMPEMKRTRFHSLNEWEGGERRSGCTDQDCLRHGVVFMSRSRCASQQGERDLGDDPARQHSSGKHRSGCVRAEMMVSTSRNKDLAATLRVSVWSQALRKYLCSTFLEEDKTANDCKAT